MKDRFFKCCLVLFFSFFACEPPQEEPPVEYYENITSVFKALGNNITTRSRYVNYIDGKTIKFLVPLVERFHSSTLNTQFPLSNSYDFYTTSFDTTIWKNCYETYFKASMDTVPKTIAYSDFERLFSMVRLKVDVVSGEDSAMFHFLVEDKEKKYECEISKAKGFYYVNK